MDAVAVSKPKAVAIAVLILWLALAIGLISLVVRLSQTAQPVSSGLLYSILAIAFAVMAFFVYKISQGRNWARITYLVLMLLGMFRTVPSLVSAIDRAPGAGALSAIVVVAQLVAIALLFTGSSNAWFRRRREP
jgi:hypothetical protein